MRKSLQKTIEIAVSQGLVVVKTYLHFSYKNYSHENKNSDRSSLLQTRYHLLWK